MLITQVDSFEEGVSSILGRQRLDNVLEELRQLVRGIGYGRGLVSVGLVCSCIGGLMAENGDCIGSGKEYVSVLVDNMREICESVLSVCDGKQMYGRRTIVEYIEGVQRRLDEWDGLE